MHNGVNQGSNHVTQVQQQRPESPMVTLTQHMGTYKALKLHQRYILNPYFFIYLPHEKFETTPEALWELKILQKFPDSPSQNKTNNSSNYGGGGGGG